MDRHGLVMAKWRLKPSCSCLDPMREELHRQRRDKILQAARQVFLTRSFDRATVDEVAKMARVSTGTVYIYFENKDRLFEAVTDLALSPFEGLFDEIEHMDGGPEPVLTRLAEVYFRFLGEPEIRAFYRIVVMEAVHRPEMSRRVYETVHRTLGAALRRMLIRLHEAGELIILDVPIAARLFQGMIEHSALTIPLVQGEAPALHPTEPYCAEVVRVFLAAYAPR
jgi:AcrR family transcriptional regulator